MTRLGRTSLSDWLEGYVLDPHRHWDRVENFLERLGLEWLWRFTKRQPARIVDRLWPHGNAHSLGDHRRELHKFSLKV